MTVNRLLILFIAIVSMSCSRDFILVQRSEDFAIEEESIDKMICVSPQVRILSKESKVELWKQERLKKILTKQVEKSAKRTNFNLEIASFNNNTDSVNYYKDLLRLRFELILANNKQETAFNFQSAPGSNAILKKVFVYPPALKHEFAEFSEKYGTPYYSFIGLYKRDKHFLLYHVIVNTSSAETVYREIRRVGSIHFRRTTISQMVYDSFAMVKNELK